VIVIITDVAIKRQVEAVIVDAIVAVHAKINDAVFVIVY